MDDVRANRLMTVPEVADMLAMKRSWVYSKVASGEIPYVKLGHYVRFVRSEIVRWVREQNGQG